MYRLPLEDDQLTPYIVLQDIVLQVITVKIRLFVPVISLKLLIIAPDFTNQQIQGFPLC